MPNSIAIRPFEPDDVPEIAALFARVFRAGRRPNVDALEAYFHSFYFEHPWPEADSPSLVCCDSAGRPRGFFGVLPFPMKLGNRSLRAAIGGNYMVDPDLVRANPFAGGRLLKAFFEQPRDLTMTDTSNANGRKAWESHGGLTLHSYSLQWLRILRPAGFALAVAGRVKGCGTLSKLARPFGHLTDAVLARVPRNPFVVTRFSGSNGHEALESRELTSEALLAGIESLRRTLPLLPDHTPESLAWLLAEAGKKREFGPLVGRTLHRNGALVGWYLYYPNAGRWAQVVQLMAKPGQTRDVIEHLFADAIDRGSVAVMGRVHPRQISDLSSLGCVFVDRDTCTQIRTRDPEIREVCLSGGALLTRLDGEWWARFQNDEFDEPLAAESSQRRTVESAIA
ncbi:MAG: hypothetical protein WD066_05760 [Planctomycetaceae bacterium]